MNQVTNIHPCLPPLDDEQREAVLDTEGAIEIIAGPGAGKTRVLAARAAYLLRGGAEPERLMCLTFTNRAADEMKRRIAGYSGMDTSRLWIGTYHSICARILRDFGGRTGFTICDEAQSARLVQSAISSHKVRVSSASVLGEIGRFKRAGISISDYLESLSSGTDPVYAGVFEQVCLLYQDALREVGALDFDDLIRETVALLREDRNALQAISSRFRYISVDEYQDTAAVEAELLRLLSSFHGNLCVVGDNDQCIYSFRGSDRRILDRFADDYGCAKTHVLSANFRSGWHIVGASESLMAGQGSRDGHGRYAVREDTGHVVAGRFDDEAEETAFIIREIEKLVKTCCLCYSDIAVLSRTQALSDSFRRASSGVGIPVGRAAGSEDGAPGVQVSTIHRSKGLEFRAVFLIGVEETILPHSRALATDESLEEERRVCYVAMTRAIDHLYLLSCSSRRISGRRVCLEESRFLRELRADRSGKLLRA